MICKGILKLLMVIFNSVIFIVGAVTVGIGFLVNSIGKSGLGTLINNEILQSGLKNLASIGYLLIVVGAVLTLMGFLGCCSACCDNNCMLIIFFIIILIVFIVEVVAAVLILIYWPKTDEQLDPIHESIAKNIRENYSKNDIIAKGWNETMNLMKCCGYNNYTDFIGSSFVNNTSQYLHICCPESPELCDIKKASVSLEHVHSCFDAVNLVKNNSSLLGGVAICVAALEVAVMIMTLLLYKK